MLLGSEGRRNAEITELAGATRPKVSLRFGRYEERGIAGVTNEQRSGWPRTINQVEVMTAT